MGPDGVQVLAMERGFQAGMLDPGKDVGQKLQSLHPALLLASQMWHMLQFDAISEESSLGNLKLYHL